MNNRQGIDFLARILTIVGALNWGLVGAARFNLVTYIFGRRSLVVRIIYTLVGLGGGILAVDLLQRFRKNQPEEAIVMYSQRDDS